MNFDFLKGIQALKYIYENCSNAEKLAVTMPVQSVFTSRKSAEMLAKVIYLAAHNEHMESMTFVDILSDPVFRDFIHDRNIINEFHFIRKKGNQAVHGDEEETADDALDVLEALHFVVGKTSCILGLIKKYPSFDYNIDAYPEAKYIDEQEVERKAQEMFFEYVEKYNAQSERDNYYKEKTFNIEEEFKALCSPVRFIPGNADLNESIEFKNKPNDERTIKMIQSHFGALGVRALKELRGELDGVIEEREVDFSCELTIYGENGYTTSDLIEYVEGIMYDLPAADGFRIISNYYGPSIAPWFECNKVFRVKPSDDKTEFQNIIEEVGLNEELTYMYHEFQYNHGEGWTEKYENGKWIDLEANYSSDILDIDFGQDWWCWNQDLYIEFDFEKHQDILEALHDVVRKRIPKDEIENCEGNWEDGENQILCPSISWTPRKLREVQDFLDELNTILKPIMNECEGSAEGNWYIKEYPFAVATWKWTDEGFKVVGTAL